MRKNNKPRKPRNDIRVKPITREEQAELNNLEGYKLFRSIEYEELCSSGFRRSVLDAVYYCSRAKFNIELLSDYLIEMYPSFFNKENMSVLILGKMLRQYPELGDAWAYGSIPREMQLDRSLMYTMVNNPKDNINNMITYLKCLVDGSIRFDNETYVQTRRVISEVTSKKLIDANIGMCDSPQTANTIESLNDMIDRFDKKVEG